MASLDEVEVVQMTMCCMPSSQYTAFSHLVATALQSKQIMLESLLCSGRPEYEGEDTSSYLSDQCDSKWPLEGYSVPEKRLLDDGGEISKRLADLRQEVSDAKVDW